MSLFGEFLAGFNAIKSACGSDPSRLVRFSRAEPRITEQCADLLGIVHQLEVQRHRNPRAFSAPVPAAFPDAYREFGAVYLSAVTQLAVPLMKRRFTEWVERIKGPDPEQTLKLLDDLLKQVRQSDPLIDFSPDTDDGAGAIADTLHAVAEIPDASGPEWFPDGKRAYAAWRYLDEIVGFDAGLSLKRWSDIPMSGSRNTFRIVMGLMRQVRCSIS